MDMLTYASSKKYTDEASKLNQEYTQTQCSSMKTIVEELIATGYSNASYVTAPDYAQLVVDGDWAPAFNACIRNHAEIYVPVGTYPIKSSIQIPSDKNLYFEKGAQIVVETNVDAIIFTGSRIKLENLNITLALDPKRHQPNRTGKIYIPYTSNMLLFPATTNGKDPIYNEFITIVDPTITGQECMGKEEYDSKGQNKYNTYTHQCHTNPYVTYNNQKETYSHGIAINFNKEAYDSKDTGIASTGMAIKIVRPRINGFSCGICMSGDKNRKGWCTEVEVKDAIIRNMGHAFDILPGWIERCKFSGYVQCHKWRGTQEYWSVVGGDFCTWDVGFWDNNFNWMYIPNNKYTRPIINGTIGDRLIYDDFGETKWINHPRHNFVPNSICYCQGLTGVTLKNTAITKVKDANAYNIHFSYPAGQKVNEIIYLKDNYSNCMMDCPTGDFTIECQINYPPRNFDVYPSFTVKNTNYIAYEGSWPTIPFGKITDVINLNLEAAVPTATFVLDNVDNLKVGDKLIIWDVVGTDNYKYITSISDCWITRTYEITAIEDNQVVVQHKDYFPQCTLESLKEEFVGHQVSKRYYPTCSKTLRVKSGQENLLKFNVHIDDFKTILKPDNLCIGLQIISASANAETPLECDIQISDIKIIT